MSDTDALLRRFFFANDQHVRNLLKLRISNLRTDFLGGVIQSYSEVSGLELCQRGRRELSALFADRQDADLFRS